MNRRLFFICPTDYLESEINDKFEGHNYFVTSLGNSIIFDSIKVGEIKTIIESKEISEILFILSDTNKIVLDAFGNQKYSNLPGIERFYKDLTSTELDLTKLWYQKNLNSFIISNHLNQKCLEMRTQLINVFNYNLIIEPRIYYKQWKAFKKNLDDILNLEINMN